MLTEGGCSDTTCGLRKEPLGYCETGSTPSPSCPCPHPWSLFSTTLLTLAWTQGWSRPGFPNPERRDGGLCSSEGRLGMRPFLKQAWRGQRHPSQTLLWLLYLRQHGQGGLASSFCSFILHSSFLRSPAFGRNH
jgi:hypothetical protein